MLLTGHQWHCLLHQSARHSYRSQAAKYMTPWGMVHVLSAARCCWQMQAYMGAFRRTLGAVDTSPVVVV